MKVVIAPDSFKESLSAAEVAEAIARGVMAACPQAVVDLCPMADGGEGTVDAMVAATGGRFASADVFDPLGRPIRARFGLLGDSPGAMLPGEVGLTAVRAAVEGEADPAGAVSVAVIEMAAASGLGLVPPEKRDPLRTTTYGTGQLILAAMDCGVRRIILGIGGSATVDGGCGAAQAMGVKFLDAAGEPCVSGLAGGSLRDIASVDVSGRDERLAGTRIRVACDVTNPLTGPQGAAAVYAPQKGATDEMIEQLDAGLSNLAAVLREQFDVDIEAIDGAGAAGGLGAGLVAFAGATLENGGKLIADALGLRRRLAGADLCITGEGRLDRQSRYGKAPVRVANLAGGEGVPTVCIAALAEKDAPRELFREVRPLVAGDVTVEMALAEPTAILKAVAEAAVLDFMKG